MWQKVVKEIHEGQILLPEAMTQMKYFLEWELQEMAGTV